MEALTFMGKSLCWPMGSQREQNVCRTSRNWQFNGAENTSTWPLQSFWTNAWWSQMQSRYHDDRVKYVGGILGWELQIRRSTEVKTQNRGTALCNGLRQEQYGTVFQKHEGSSRQLGEGNTRCKWRPRSQESGDKGIQDIAKSGKNRLMSKDPWGGHSMKNVLEKSCWGKGDWLEFSLIICLISKYFPGFHWSDSLWIQKPDP